MDVTARRLEAKEKNGNTKRSERMVSIEMRRNRMAIR